MPKTYKRVDQPIQTPLPPPVEIQHLRDYNGKLLHDLEEASHILTKLLGRGFSVPSLRRLMDNNPDFIKGKHWFVMKSPRQGVLRKLNIPNVIDWATQEET